MNLNDLTFNYTSLGVTMREILITLINRIPRPEDDPRHGMKRSEAFFAAQKQVVAIRRACTKACGRHTDTGTPLWCYGLAAHQMIVDQQKLPRHVVNMRTAELARKAQAIMSEYEALEVAQVDTDRVERLVREMLKKKMNNPRL